MSWDIFVVNVPPNIQQLDQIPPGFTPPPLGPRQQIIDGIKSLVPIADFRNPSWGLIEGDGWSIEVNLGDEELCNGFAFHVRGGDAAVGVIAAILDKLGLRAVDSETGDFFVPGEHAVQSFNKWKSYRDRCVAGE